MLRWCPQCRYSRPLAIQCFSHHAVQCIHQVRWCHKVRCRAQGMHSQCPNAAQWSNVWFYFLFLLYTNVACRRTIVCNRRQESARRIRNQTNRHSVQEQSGKYEYKLNFIANLFVANSKFSFIHLIHVSNLCNFLYIDYWNVVPSVDLWLNISVHRRRHRCQVGSLHQRRGWHRHSTIASVDQPFKVAF